MDELRKHLRLVCDCKLREKGFPSPPPRSGKLVAFFMADLFLIHPYSEGIASQLPIYAETHHWTSHGGGPETPRLPSRLAGCQGRVHVSESPRLLGAKANVSVRSPARAPNATAFLESVDLLLSFYLRGIFVKVSKYILNPGF